MLSKENATYMTQPNLTPGVHPLDAVPPETQEKLLQVVMHRQARLSLQVASLFLIPLFGLPLLNQYLPDVMNRQVLGFSVTWLILGVCFFPLTWLLSAYFVRKSDSIESECAVTARKMLPENIISNFQNSDDRAGGQE